MEMSSEKQQLPKPKRRWFQLRLRTLLVLVTLASATIGWVVVELEQRRAEKVAIAWVEKMGGEVTFGSVEKDGFPSETSWWKKTKDTLFGENVTSISLYGTQVSDLTPLAGLKNLRDLDLNETKVSDLSPLAGLKQLRWLHLDGTKVNNLSPLALLKNLEILTLDGTEVRDLSPLEGMKNLEVLILKNTQIGEEQIEQLQLALPNCKISR